MTTLATTDATEKYAAAHESHYTAKDLPKAIEFYNAIIIAHPASPEAGYSRTQIQNIANRVIAKDVHLEAQMKLTLDALAENSDTRTAKPAPAEESSG